MKNNITYQEHPEIAKLKENHTGNQHALLVLVQSAPDSLHRQKFTMWWWANNIGYSCNETGWRGQCFHSVLCDHLIRDQHHWQTIEIVNHFDNQ